MARRQGAVSRGWSDLKIAANHWRFRLPAGALTAAFAAVGAAAAEKATPAERVAFAVSGTIGGGLLLGVLAFVALVVTAPVRQRNEAWDREAADVDRVQLAREAYQEGTAVKHRNAWGDGAPTTPEEAAEAQKRAWQRAIEWGTSTWEMVLRNFPGHYERDFFGADIYAHHGMGRVGFQLAADAEKARYSVEAWIDGKLAVLADLLNEYDR